MNKMKNAFLFSLVLMSMMACTNEQKAVYDPQADFEAIRAVMKMQEQAWSSADVEGFMQGYWESEELTFIGSKGLAKGWETTLANYKKSYPDAAAMGTLTFDVLDLRSLSEEHCYMIGQYKLKREEEELGGYFTLLWRKVDGQWKIVADQTCG